MKPEIIRVGAIALITVLVTMGVLIYFNSTNPEAEVVSSIDEVAYQIDDQGADAINVSIQFGITIENYGRLRQVEIPCSTIQSHMQVKNSTTNLVSFSSEFASNTSYILDTRVFETSCDGEATTFTVSENIINEIIVVVPFRLVNGNYSFIWYHSFADTYEAATIIIDLDASNPVSSLLEATENQ